MITVHSLERAQGTPVYPGHMEITEERDGLLLLNEVDLEEYLKRVTPSEMPPTYELEALKAHIAAREATKKTAASAESDEPASGAPASGDSASDETTEN